jgi:hypothetical protein
VLNADNFIGARETNPGGGAKDFFGGRDADFVEHKRNLVRQVEAARATLANSEFGGVAYARVMLNRSALAKSHRPTSTVFTPGRTPVVGTRNVGELIIEVTPEGLIDVEQAIEGAEEETRSSVDRKTGKELFKPSRRRSEVGAVDQIELWTAADKRSFSASQAVEWLADRRTGGAYRVYLFSVPAAAGEADTLSTRKRELFESFVEGLRAVGRGLVAQRLDRSGSGRPVLAIRLGSEQEAPLVDLFGNVRRRVGRRLSELDRTVVLHERLLQFLDRHPLVRSVELPPKVHQSGVVVPPFCAPTIPTRQGGSHPIVGIIDGGLGSHFGDWVRHRWGVLAEEDRDEAHGSFIGGILVAGSSYNPSGAVREPDGCDLVDVDVFPADDAGFAQYYPNGVADFLDEVEEAIASCRSRFGVRVFNLSLNTNLLANIDRYSIEAGRLDRIAEDHDVLLIISAGNLLGADARPEWEVDDDRVLAGLARSRNDGILVPAESVRNLSVAALNPPGHPASIPFAPASYSRRGPGLRTGLKPDLAHVGGAGPHDPVVGSGLFSCAADGSNCSERGTSFAAPQVAKTVARLDAIIEGSVSRETLIALVIHSARIPSPVMGRALADVARDLVGFGHPNVADEILEGDDHKITLVFASRLHVDKELTFDFAWPPSLVGPDGQCKGEVNLTLVATPPLDHSHGAEFVRVNIEAHLQQEHKGKFASRLMPAYLPQGVENGTYEADLIDHALKWGPTKIYARRMPKGVGRSSRWRLAVSYLTRSGEAMPENGVPFTAILTIADPAGEKPVFNEMRQALQAQGVVTADIQTAARVTSRV